MLASCVSAIILRHHQSLTVDGLIVDPIVFFGAAQAVCMHDGKAAVEKTAKFSETHKNPKLTIAAFTAKCHFNWKISSCCVKWHLLKLAHKKAPEWALPVCLYVCGPLARLTVFALHVWHSNYLSALALARLLFLYRLTLWR